MPILSVPQYNPTSAYQPVVYELTQIAFGIDVIKYVEFTVFVEGVAIATDLKQFTKTSPIGGFTEYFFEVDIQNYLRRYLATRVRYSMFGDPSEDYRVANNDAYVELYLEFRYLYVSAVSGKVIDLGVLETSGAHYANITKRLNGGYRDLTTEFIGITSPLAPKRPLTNRPTTINICRSGTDFLTIISNWSHLRVEVFDASGISIGIHYLPTNAAGAQQTTIGTSPNQLLDSVDWIAGMPNFAGSTSYTIQFGSIVILPDQTIIWNPASIVYTYEITECCDSRLNVLWLNDLGGVDSASFGYSELEDGVTSEEFEKPLGWDNLSATPHDQSDYGIVSNDIKVTRAFNILLQVRPAKAVWLRELKWSAEVYMQNPFATISELKNKLWRVSVDPSTFVERKINGLIEFNLRLNLAQEIPTHRV